MNAARPEVADTSSAVSVVVLMGVAGAGKTYVGHALAAATGWPFFDGDDFHSAANVDKMRHGVGLTDEDRAPWLERLQTLIGDTLQADGRAVLACSALRQSYREALVPPSAPPGAVRFVYLDVPREVLRERLAGRAHHYAGPALLDSQLETLEEPRDALRVDGTLPVEQIVAHIRTQLAI